MADDLGPDLDGLDETLRRLFDDARRTADVDVAAMPDALDDVAIVDAEVIRADVGAVAVRSASATVSEQLVVRGEWTDVVIDVSPGLAGDARRDVRGTVLDVDEPCAVQLMADGREVALDVTDVFGDFALRSVEPGRYTLVVAAARAELTAELDVR